uniref:Tetraketide alpha-pyrone reductase 1-like n=1 Tax=Nelumbo nucifera TaxID=4432 RepID=A0A822Z7X6_NELNU|nr:TPA_asm: hypothetical protein HUJ06_013812 [Nelumbo nucifera]
MRTKMTGWMYFVSKTLAEKAAWEFAEENNIDLISVIPPLVVGPFLGPSMPLSITMAFALITGMDHHYHHHHHHHHHHLSFNDFKLLYHIFFAGIEYYYSIMKQCNFVHLDGLCNAHIFLF